MTFFFVLAFLLINLTTRIRASFWRYWSVEKTGIIMARDIQIRVMSLQIQSININERQYSYSIQDGCESFKYLKFTIHSVNYS